MISARQIEIGLAVMQSAFPAQADQSVLRKQPAAAFTYAQRDKHGRVTVPCVVDRAYLDPSGALVLTAPPPVYDIGDLVKNPELRDTLEVRLLPALVRLLKRLG